LKLSVGNIENLRTYNDEGEPCIGGINDLRMGTINKLKNCETCGCDCNDCPGHFGHIELVKPVFHVGFLQTINKILKAVCFNCSKILLPKNSKFKEIIRIKNPKFRQHAMLNACKLYRDCKIFEKKDEVKN
jgi:DNA-directed RNA polymerase II subunit RPB1